MTKSHTTFKKLQKYTMAHLQFQKKCFQIITDQIKGRERCFSVFMRNPTCFHSKLRDKETR